MNLSAIYGEKGDNMKKMVAIITTIALLVASILSFGMLTSCSNSKTKELIDAIKAKDKEKVESLLKSGVDPNKGTLIFGFSCFQEKSTLYPLFEAIGTSDNLDVLKLLVEYGAKVNQYQQRPYASTPLCYAIGNSEYFYYLIEMGGDIHFYSTNLIVRASFNNAQIIPEYVQGEFPYLDRFYFLLANGVDINEKDEDGAIALVKICLTNAYVKSLSASELSNYIKRLKEQVQLLLDNGADYTIKDKNDKSAYDYVAENKFTEILELFSQY